VLGKTGLFLNRTYGDNQSFGNGLLDLLGEAGLEGVREFHEQGPTSALAEHAQVRAFLKQTLGLNWRKTAAVPFSDRDPIVLGFAERVAAIGDHAQVEAWVPALRPGCPLRRRPGQVATEELEDFRDNAFGIIRPSRALLRGRASWDKPRPGW